MPLEQQQQKTFVNVSSLVPFSVVCDAIKWLQSIINQLGGEQIRHVKEEEEEEKNLLTASMRCWKSDRAALELEMALPTLPTMVAKMRTPTRQSMMTKTNSESLSGGGISPIVVRVNADQKKLKPHTQCHPLIQI